MKIPEIIYSKEDIKYLISFLIVFVVCFFIFKITHLIIRTLEKKNQNEKKYRNHSLDEKNIIDNGIKIGSSKYNPITVTFSNGRKKLSLAVPYPEINLAILDGYSRYVGADRIDNIGENLDVNYTVTRGKPEISGYCEQFVMIINNSLLQELLNEYGVSVRQS